MLSMNVPPFMRRLEQTLLIFQPTALYETVAVSNWHPLHTGSLDT